MNTEIERRVAKMRSWIASNWILSAAAAVATIAVGTVVVVRRRRRRP